MMLITLLYAYNIFSWPIITAGIAYNIYTDYTQCDTPQSVLLSTTPTISASPDSS